MKLAAAFWCLNLLMQMVQKILMFCITMFFLHHNIVLAGISDFACLLSLLQQDTTMQADALPS